MLNNKYIDLHTHSTASDGSLSPIKLIQEAKMINLSYISLTDHDTMQGIPEAYNEAKLLGINFIPGIEMSCAYNDSELHILGYMPYFDGDMGRITDIQKDIEIFASKREARNAEILRRLNDAGYNISYDDLIENNPDTKITRSHFALALFKKGYVNDRKQAFDEILADNSPFIPKKEVSIDDVCNFFNRHNFFFSLAHPLLYKLSNKELNTCLSLLKDKGMNGIEVYHSTHHINDSLKLKKLATEYSLLPTGGSDFHGDAKPGLLLGRGYGSLNIPESVIKDIYHFLDNK